MVLQTRNDRFESTQPSSHPSLQQAIAERRQEWRMSHFCDRGARRNSNNLRTLSDSNRIGGEPMIDADRSSETNRGDRSESHFQSPSCLSDISQPNTENSCQAVQRVLGSSEKFQLSVFREKNLVGVKRPLCSRKLKPNIAQVSRNKSRVVKIGKSIPIKDKLEKGNVIVNIKMDEQCSFEKKLSRESVQQVEKVPTSQTIVPQLKAHSSQVDTESQRNSYVASDNRSIASTCCQTNFSSTSLEGNPVEVTVYHVSCELDSNSCSSNTNNSNPSDSRELENQCEDPCCLVEPNKYPSNPSQGAQGGQTGSGQTEQYNKCPSNPCKTKLDKQCRLECTTPSPKKNESNYSVGIDTCPAARENKCQKPCQQNRQCPPTKCRDNSFESTMYRPTFFSSKLTTGKPLKEKSQSLPGTPDTANNSSDGHACQSDFKRFDTCDIPSARVEFTRNIEKTIQILDAVYSGSDPKSLYGYSNGLKFMRSLKDDNDNIPRNVCAILKQLDRKGSEF